MAGLAQDDDPLVGKQWAQRLEADHSGAVCSKEKQKEESANDLERLVEAA